MKKLFALFCVISMLLSVNITAFAGMPDRANLLAGKSYIVYDAKGEIVETGVFSDGRAREGGNINVNIPAYGSMSAGWCDPADTTHNPDCTGIFMKNSTGVLEWELSKGVSNTIEISGDLQSPRSYTTSNAYNYKEWSVKNTEHWTGMIVNNNSSTAVTIKYFWLYDN